MTPLNRERLRKLRIENDRLEKRLWPVEAIQEMIAELRAAATLHFGRDWEGRLRARHGSVPSWFHGAWVDEQERWQSTVMGTLESLGRKYSAGDASASSGDKSD